MADTTGSKVGESLEKETFVEVTKEVGGDRRVSINQERTSQCSTLPEDIDQERTGRIMDASVEDDARGVLSCGGERKASPDAGAGSGSGRDAVVGGRSSKERVVAVVCFVLG